MICTSISQSRIRLAILSLVALTLAVSCGRRSSENLTDKQVEARILDKTDYFLDDIDATDTQSKRIKSDVSAFVPRVNEVRKLRDPIRVRLAAQLTQSKPDKAQVRAVIDDIHKEMTPFAHDALDLGLKTHANLTKEQRAELAQRWEDRKQGGDRAWIIDAVVKRFLDEIDATDAQFEYALAQKDAQMEKAKKLKADHQKTRAFFIQELRSPKPDSKGLHAQVDAGATRLQAFAHGVADSVVGFAQTLTPEQREKVKELIADMRG